MDQAIALWSAELERIPWLDQIMLFITNLGEKGFFWILLCLALLVFPKTRKAGAVCFFALALYTVVGNLILKPLVARARPFDALELTMLIPHPGGYSFPSGHTGASFATATAFYLFYRGWPGKCAIALAGLIAFTRLFFVVHYFTDVLAGAILGIACAYLAKWILLYNKK